jgi:hypothetical protein
MLTPMRDDYTQIGPNLTEAVAALARVHDSGYSVWNQKGFWDSDDERVVCLGLHLLDHRPNP